jgi:hypothetical protein
LHPSLQSGTADGTIQPLTQGNYLDVLFKELTLEHRDIAQHSFKFLYVMKKNTIKISSNSKKEGKNKLVKGKACLYT